MRWSTLVRLARSCLRRIGGATVPPPGYVQLLPLMPVERPGPLWGRHRRTLELNASHEDIPDDVLIVNETQRQTFRWAWRPRRTGTIYFWVPTRYAVLLNRDWRRNEWFLYQPGQETHGTPSVTSHT